MPKWCSTHLNRVFFAILVAMGVARDASATGYLYWTELSPNQIVRSNADGSGKQVLLSNLSYQPSNVVVDLDAGKIFWDTVNLNLTGIHVANLDGSNEQTILASVRDWGLDLDPIHHQLYYSTGTRGTSISYNRANYDGTNSQSIMTRSGTTGGFALDLVHSKIYYERNATGNFPGKNISRSNLDGSQPQMVASDDVLYGDYALDTVGGKIYWTQGSNDSNTVIRRANLDGTGAETIMSSGTLQSLGGPPRSLAVDEVLRQLDFGIISSPEKFMRSNLDGTGISVLISPLAGDEFTLEVAYPLPVPEPSSVALGTIAFLFTCVWWSRIVKTGLSAHRTADS